MALRFFRSKHLVARVSALAVFNVAPRVLPTAVLTEHTGTTDDGFTGGHELFKALGTADRDRLGIAGQQRHSVRDAEDGIAAGR